MNADLEVKEVFSEVLGVNITLIKNESTMEDLEGWDSIHNLILISSIEEKLGINIPEEDIFDLISVQSFINEVVKLRK